jgi:hypothetical protein
MLYELVFYLNLDLEISNQLDKVTIIILFHILKALRLFPLMKLYTSFLDKPLISESTIFFFDLNSQ